MHRTAQLCVMAATRCCLSGTSTGPTPYQDRSYPVQPHSLNELQPPPQGTMKNPVLSKLLDQTIPAYDDFVTGASRLYWQ